MLAISVRIFASHPIVIFRCGEVLAAESDLRLTVKQTGIDVGVFDGQLASLEATLTMARLRCPSMRPLLLSNPLSEDECLRWMFRGVRGIVTYGRYEKDLPQAVRKLAQGGLYFSSHVVNRWERVDPRVRAATQFVPLTRREMEVAGLLSRGLSNKQIATSLGLADRTVKFHVRNILTKVGLRSRYELHAALPAPARLAVRTGATRPV